MSRIGLLVVGLGMVGTLPLLAQATGDAAKGEKIYAEQKCSVCHRIGSTGGRLGTDLTTVGDTRDLAWLKKYLADPKGVDPDNRMPPVKVDGQDLDDLIAYLLTLKAGK